MTASLDPAGAGRPALPGSASERCGLRAQAPAEPDGGDPPPKALRPAHTCDLVPSALSPRRRSRCRGHTVRTWSRGNRSPGCTSPSEYRGNHRLTCNSQTVVAASGGALTLRPVTASALEDARRRAHLLRGPLRDPRPVCKPGPSLLLHTKRTPRRTPILRVCKQLSLPRQTQLPAPAVRSARHKACARQTCTKPPFEPTRPPRSPRGQDKPPGVTLGRPGQLCSGWRPLEARGGSTCLRARAPSRARVRIQKELKRGGPPPPPHPEGQPPGMGVGESGNDTQYLLGICACPPPIPSF